MGTTHQHIYNFRLDLDVDGENNSLVAMDPVVKPNTAGGPRTSTMQVNQYNIGNEQDAAQKFDPGTIRLLSNLNKENRMGNPVSYQIIPYAGGTHPVAKGAQFAPDEWIYHRLSFMDKQLWVTRYHPGERFRKANIRTVLLMTPVLDNTVRITSRWTTPTPLSG